MAVKMIKWWLPPEQRNEKKRREYKWGAKAYLSSFEIGEVRRYRFEYRWDSLKSLASKMKALYGCQYSFSSTAGHRIIVRIK